MRILLCLFGILVFTGSLSSCKKTSQDPLIDGSLTTINVSLAGSDFDAFARIGHRSATPQAASASAEHDHLQQTIDLGNNLLLLAELIPEQSESATPNIGSPARNATGNVEIERNLLAENIRYKVAVYDNAGNFVTERDYVHGRESATPILQLDHGRTYTFIVYSVNSSNPDGSGLPGIVFVGGSRTLAASTFVAPGNSDPMYFKKTMTLDGGITNRLDVILKHRFSQITTIINTEQTGYLPKEITASFTPHRSSASINLEHGLITRTGNSDRATVSATFSENKSTVSYTTMINNDANSSTSYNIASFTVGDLTLRNLTPFTDLKITPGVKYNLVLDLVPTDGYLTHAGLPAVRIGKTIWARHNLGVDPTLDPDASPLTAAHHGNYYQWGTNIVSGSGTAATAAPFDASNNPSDDSWNRGTEDEPIKAAADPCPTGYRIPTRKEVNELVQNMSAINVGESRNSRDNYNSGKQLTSKRKRGVIMTLPSQGWLTISGGQRPYNNGGSQYRGTEGYYHSSYAQGDATAHLYFSRNSFSPLNRSANQMNKVVSMTIRCVAE